MYTEEYINKFTNCNKEYIAVYTDTQTKLKISNIAENEDRSMSTICNNILKQYLEENYKILMGLEGDIENV